MSGKRQPSDRSRGAGEKWYVHLPPIFFLQTYHFFVIGNTLIWFSPAVKPFRSLYRLHQLWWDIPYHSQKSLESSGGPRKLEMMNQVLTCTCTIWNSIDVMVLGYKILSDGRSEKKEEKFSPTYHCFNAWEWFDCLSSLIIMWIGVTRFAVTELHLHCHGHCYGNHWVKVNPFGDDDYIVLWYNYDEKV